MQTNRKNLAQRRMALLAKVQVQRENLKDNGRQFTQSLQFVELGFQVGQTIKRYPWLSLGIAATTVLVKPKRIWTILKTGLMAWEIWQSITPTSPTEPTPKQ